MSVNYQIDPRASKNKLNISNIAWVIIVLLLLSAAFIAVEKTGGGLSSYNTYNPGQGTKI